VPRQRWKTLYLFDSEKLTNIFGYWPPFHDAEVLQLQLDRGNVQADEGIYKLPVLTLTIHVWELTKEVNAEGYLVCRHHTVVTLNFCDVSDVEMEGFNHQNVMGELSIISGQRSEGPSPYFNVEVVPSFGMGASFKCLRIEVIDAVLCAANGKIV
jgi:hypothetical protein